MHIIYKSLFPQLKNKAVKEDRKSLRKQSKGFDSKQHRHERAKEKEIWE